jgi:hypothetical protein
VWWWFWFGNPALDNDLEITLKMLTFTASTFFSFISAAQWRYVNFATDVTKASLWVCIPMTAVTCTAH